MLESVRILRAKRSKSRTFTGPSRICCMKSKLHVWMKRFDVKEAHISVNLRKRAYESLPAGRRGSVC